ncbi:MAG TPA: glycosyltransferase [Chloroflexota bacterium]|nr:glycosyltransferase [Chloroflexota bacterium]
MTSRAATSGPGRVALVHDYLTQYGGAEAVLEALHALWPGAPVFTTLYDAPLMRRLGFRVPSSAIYPLLPRAFRLPGRAAKVWTPIYPLVFRRLDLGGFDTVISSTSFAAHQVQVPPGAVHVAYCHSPPRFLYGLSSEVDHARLRARVPGLGAAYRLLRELDRQAARRVTAFVANSEVVRRRILRFYGRDARVIYPPVPTRAFAGARLDAGADYFFTWSRLVASKRIDIIVEAANRGRLPLLVAGDGPEEARLRAMAGPTVAFAGRPARATLLRLIERCRAVVFAAEEDFGMVPVEAMAAGKPVVAYGAGGARETVVPGVTGEWFPVQTPEALLSALRAFDPRRYDPLQCRSRAAAFDQDMFMEHMARFVEAVSRHGVATSGRFE